MRRLITVILAGILAVVSVSHWIGFAEIAGHSMYPLLDPRDIVFFYKDGAQGIERGDVIIFQPPAQWFEDNESNTGGGLVIKRVVGLPGETITLPPVPPALEEEGVLNINLIKENAKDPAGLNTFWLLIDDEPVAFVHKVVGEFDSLHPKEKSVTVPSGHYYVVGDNLPMSLDSRKYGPLPAESVVGKMFNYLD